VTRSDKTSFIAQKYICLCNRTYLLFCIRNNNSVIFRKLSRDFYISGKNLAWLWCSEKKFLTFKLWKSGQIWQAIRFILSDWVTFIFFSHWPTAKYVNFMRKKLYSITSYVFLHVCDLFSYAHVNVNMYFETVLFIEGSLSHWALT